MESKCKKGRIRAGDLRKSFGKADEPSKYDFSKIRILKGEKGRDESKKGRPPGICASVPRPTFSTFENGAVPMEIETKLHTESVSQCQYQLQQTIHVPVLNEQELYISLLKENKAFYAVDAAYNVYVMQEFDCNHAQLKPSHFVIIKRRCMAFLETPHWVFTCSCDKVTSDLIDCCVEQMEVSYQDFRLRTPGCLHVTTAGLMLEPFYAQNDIEPELPVNEEEDETDASPSTIDMAVKMLRDGLFYVDSEKPGIILQTADGFKCLTCNCLLNKCSHLQKFFEIYEEEEQKREKKNAYQQKCFSELRIPFYSTKAMQTTIKKTISERFPGGNARICSINLMAEKEVCDACGNYLEYSTNRRRGNLFLLQQIIEVNVLSKICSNCMKEFHLDGFELCILNMGRNIYCYEILKRFMYCFLSGKSTIFTEYQVLRKIYIDAGYENFEELMTYQDFKYAWYAFLDLLDIDYEASFVCPYCGPDPDTVIMDATSVSFRKELMSWKSLFADQTNNIKPCDAADADRARERVFFSRTVRKLLTNYIKPTSGISKADKEKLYYFIKVESKDSSVFNLMHFIIEDSIIRGDCILVKDVWRDFLKIISSSSPVCGSFPPSEKFYDFLYGALSNRGAVLKNDMQLAELQRSLPVIFKLITRLKTQFPFQLFEKCLPYLKEKSFSPFLKNACPLGAPEQEDGLSYFPHLQAKRSRGLYVADKKGHRSKEDSCSKFSKGHPSLLPGVFTVYCPHAICYGFNIMKLHESPDVPFTILRTRFRTAPRLVVYDNACSLHTYCLNRDPVFFSETTFRVDALHFKNHKACGPGYELKRYPQHFHLNSQVVEQANSRLQRIKGSLSYMTQNNFIKHCRFYLWGQNEEVIKKC